MNMSKSIRTLASLVTITVVLVSLCVLGFTSVGAARFPESGGGALLVTEETLRSEFRQGVDGYSGCVDTYITSWYPENNYCSDSELRVKGDGPMRTLIRFDLSGFTLLDEIAEAYLELYVRGEMPGFNSMKAHAVRRDWNCGQANWLYARAGDTWAEAGCNHPDLDYYFEAGNAFPSPDRAGFYRLEISRQTVTSWLSYPSTNKGLILIGEGGYDYFSFTSSEEPLASRRPVLVIRWVTPVPTGTPSPGPSRTPTVTGTPVTSTPTKTPTVTPTPTQAPPPAYIAITAYPTSVTVDQTSAITVTVTDAFGHNVVDGTVVTYTATLGHFGGGITNTTRTTLGGKASVLLHSTKTGTAIVQGRVRALSADVAVTFSSGSPHTIALTVTPGVIPGCGGTAIAEALVTDRYGNSVRDGTVVVFDVTPQGEVQPIGGGRTTNGVASAIVSSGTVPGPATVWAWWGVAHASVAGNFPVVFEVGPADQVSLTAEPMSILVGGNQATLRLLALDCAGLRVVDGTPVTFTLASGTGTIQPAVTTTANGRASSTLTSPNETGSATVRANVGDRQAAVVVEYIPGRPFDVTLMANPLSIPADGLSTSTIVAEVRDLYGNAVADRTTVAFSTDLGRFETGSSYTASTMGGSASAVLTSSSTPGTARVSAIAGGKRGEIYVDFYYGVTPTLTPTRTATPTATPTREWAVWLPILLRRRWLAP
jgi:hypothetical protein